MPRVLFTSRSAGLLLALLLCACRQEPAGEAPSEERAAANTAASAPNADINASLETVAEAPSHGAPAPRFVGRWAPTRRECASNTWRFSAEGLETPNGWTCRFSDVREVPGGYDIGARCTVEGPERDDVVRLRFVEAIGGMSVESDALTDAGLIRCGD